MYTIRHYHNTFLHINNNIFSPKSNICKLNVYGTFQLRKSAWCRGFVNKLRWTSQQKAHCLYNDDNVVHVKITNSIFEHFQFSLFLFSVSNQVHITSNWTGKSWKATNNRLLFLMHIAQNKKGSMVLYYEKYANMHYVKLTKLHDNLVQCFRFEA